MFTAHFMDFRFKYILVKRHIFGTYFWKSKFSEKYCENCQKTHKTPSTRSRPEKQKPTDIFSIVIYILRQVVQNYCNFHLEDVKKKYFHTTMNELI